MNCKKALDWEASLASEPCGLLNLKEVHLVYTPNYTHLPRKLKTNEKQDFAWTERNSGPHFAIGPAPQSNLARVRLRSLSSA